MERKRLRERREGERDKRGGTDRVERLNVREGREHEELERGNLDRRKRET